MKITIRDSRVRDNITLFKTLIARQVVPSRKSVSSSRLKVYEGYVHKINGQFRFGSLPASFPKREWKPICVRLRLAGLERNKGLFEVVESGAYEESFNCADLQPLAYKVMAKTVQTLNAICTHASHPFNPEEVLQEIAHLDIAVPQKEFAMPPLMERAWHRVDRMGAEKLLQDKPVGAFLFRQDPFAGILEYELCHHFAAPIQCATITFVGEGGKISDLTVVHKKEGWLIYDNDPNLREETYSHFDALLQSRPELVTPLLKEMAQNPGVHKRS